MAPLKLSVWKGWNDRVTLTFHMAGKWLDNPIKRMVKQGFPKSSELSFRNYTRKLPIYAVGNGLGWFGDFFVWFRTEFCTEMIRF